MYCELCYAFFGMFPYEQVRLEESRANARVGTTSSGGNVMEWSRVFVPLGDLHDLWLVTAFLGNLRWSSMFGSFKFGVLIRARSTLEAFSRCMSLAEARRHASFGWHSHGFLAQRSLHSRVVSRNFGTHRVIFTRRTSSSHYKTATSFETFARSWIPMLSCGSGDNCKQNDLCECCYTSRLITFRNVL